MRRPEADVTPARRRRGRALAVAALLWSLADVPCALAALAGPPAADNLLVAARGQARAFIGVAADASPLERQAAGDLQHYVAEMTGARLPMRSEPADIDAALARGEPAIMLGAEALARAPELRARLARAVKPNPVLRADAIALRREGSVVYLAGANELNHYHAVAELLRRWGVRWFMPGAFGECVPDEDRLEVGDLDEVYAPPFEARTFWVSWLGYDADVRDFQLRNMMTLRAELPPTGHALDPYLTGLREQGPVAMTAPETAAHVADHVADKYAAGDHFSLGMEDRLYEGLSEADQRVAPPQWDRYMWTWSATDPMLEFYNNVGERLRARFPASKALIGFLIYSNMTLPPVRDMTAAPNLYAELAGIDFDPIHGMDDPRSRQKQEYKAIMSRWSRIMGGRLAIYDYDQSMLVWRDLPNPTHQAFAQDVRHYRDAGVLGVNTESRMALATTFLNLYLRARLLWNPDDDVDALLEEFYRPFYGPAAAPMKAYWTTIFEAWKTTTATEHEHFVAPAIYTRELIEKLRPALVEAEAALQASRSNLNASSYAERVRFTRLSFDLIEAYVEMTHAAATEADYAAAVAWGERALSVRAALTEMHPSFTTTRLEDGPAWWPGEVDQYRSLLAFTNGDKGRLIERLPLEWRFRHDQERRGDQEARQVTEDGWSSLRTDLYAQAQGVANPDGENATGDFWYKTSFRAPPLDGSRGVHVRFPGVFGSCRLLLNERLVAERSQTTPWWLNDYRFEWDVALDAAAVGVNQIALNCSVDSHFGGLFRRPFVYNLH